MEINDPKIQETILKLGLNDEIISKYFGEADAAQEKIFTKFKEANEGQFYARRWLWELLQNAADTVNVGEKVDVTIHVEKTDLSYFVIFEHNGGPFMYGQTWNKYHEFKNFILAKSGKYADDDKVGKFGTGFLSTHCISDKITVEGKCIEKDNSTFYRRIILDRGEFRNEDQQSVQIRTLKIIKSLNDYDSNALPAKDQKYSAKFTYEVSEEHFSLVKEGLQEMAFTIPYVFTFNPKLSSINVKLYNGTDIVYKSEEIKEFEGFKIHDTTIISSTQIETQTKLKSIAFLSNDKCTIAWKVKKENENIIFRNDRQGYVEKFKIEMHSLFCQFPLIGSELFKFPVVINSKDFRPEEKRHGINLIEQNPINKEIIDSAIELYKTYLKLAIKVGIDLYNIANTLYKSELPRWIDEDWYKSKVNEIRDFIKVQTIIDINKNKSERKQLVSSDGKHIMLFPFVNMGDMQLSIKLYEFAYPLYSSLLPTKETLLNWLNTLWVNTKDVKRLLPQDYLAGFAKYNEFSKIKAALNSEDNHTAINWLKDLYSFIIDDLENETLLEIKDQESGNGVVLTRNLKFKKLSELRVEEGFENQKIDSVLLEIYDLLYKPEVKMGDRIIEQKFNYLIPSDREKITEKYITEQIKAKAEELIKRHDEIFKLLNQNTIQSLTPEKNEIESKLSRLQDWIALNNEKKKYFDNHIKRKILQTIIDEKKSNQLTKLLELDRNEQVSLEQQTAILSDSDLNAKLTYGNAVLESIREKEKVDHENREIGNHFERLFQESMSLNNIPCLKRDGEQDFILYHGTDNEKYIELKSIHSSKSKVKISPEQADKSISKGSNYFLCIIPYTGDPLQIDQSTFVNISRFSNSIQAGVKDKIGEINSFVGSNQGINGVLPSLEILSQYREKQYMIEINRNSISNMTHDEFKRTINQL